MPNTPQVSRRWLNTPAPLLLAQARALLADSTAVVVQEDLRNPEAILQHPITTANLDFTEPVALLVAIRS